MARRWRHEQCAAAFGACEAEEDGAALWAHPKSSRPVLGVVGVRGNGGMEVGGRRLGARLFGGVRAAKSQGADVGTSTRRRRSAPWMLPATPRGAASHAPKRRRRWRHTCSGRRRRRARSGSRHACVRATAKPAPCRESRHGHAFSPWMLWWCGALLRRVSSRRGGWSKGDRSDSVSPSTAIP